MGVKGTYRKERQEWKCLWGEGLNSFSSLKWRVKCMMVVEIMLLRSDDVGEFMRFEK